MTPVTPEHETAWLIERGQPEGLQRPEWWTQDEVTGAQSWGREAWRAVWYPSKERAQEQIDRFNLPNHPFRARAVEHGFVQSPVTPEAEPLRDALDEVLRPYLELMKMPDATIEKVLVASAARLAGYYGVRAASPEPGLRAALKAMVEHDAEMFDNCGDWGTDSCEYRLRAEAVLRASPDRLAGGLDEAWAKAEAALPKGWVIDDLQRMPRKPWTANASVGWSLEEGDHVAGEGPTPAAALLALAERLSNG